MPPERMLTEWSGPTRPGGKPPLMAYAYASPLGGVLRWCRWLAACLLTPVILLSYLATVAVLAVIFSPLIVIGIRKGTFLPMLRHFPWIPPDLARLLIPPRTEALRRLLHLMARKR
jgi:hypothetical protein